MKALQGLLIYNAGLINEKFLEINNMYIEAAKKIGVKLSCIKNTDINIMVDEDKLRCKSEYLSEKVDFILFLDKDIRLARQLEKDGYRLFNSADTIEWCDDKIRTAQIVAGNNIKMPKTIFSSLVFYETIPKEDSYYNNIELELDYPMVVKQAFGSFGEGVFLVNNRDELINVHKLMVNKPHIYQEFIKSSKGRDVRIQVVGNRAVAAMLRTSETDFRANITNGGKMHSVVLGKDFYEMAINAAKTVQADFAGVDILFDENDEPILCEINSNAHIKNIYECTGVDVANEILNYIVGEIDDN